MYKCKYVFDLAQYISKQTGLEYDITVDVLLGRKTCDKMTAYCIAKATNANYEIVELFERV